MVRNELQFSSFGEALRRYRLQAGWTQEELAERAAISVGAIASLESGRRRSPRRDTVQQLVDALALDNGEHEVLTDLARRADLAGPLSSDDIQHQQVPIGGFLGARPPNPIIGREDELSTLDQALDAIQLSTGQFVLVTGEPGVGKTRLAQEIDWIARNRGFMVATGRCSGAEQQTPFYAVRQALEHLYTSISPSLRSQVARSWQYVGRLLPEYLTPPTSSADADEERIRVFRAVSGFLLAVSRERPVAVLLDDLHHADLSTLHLLHHLAPAMRGARVLILATCRDSETRPDTPLGEMTRSLGREHLVEKIALRRLTPDDTAAMVEMYIGEVAPEFAEFVHRRTRGIPFYVHQMVQALHGRYRLVQEIGAGGMGRVFEAVDHQTGARVAAKIMFSTTEVDLDALLRFQREGLVLQTLKHPNIVEVYTSFSEEYAAAIIMELLERSLADELKGTPVRLGRTRQIMRQVADAVAFAHAKSIAHRDIKPDNIMLVAGDHVKVTDFGIARLLRSPETSATGRSTGLTLGTPLYMAPEQIEGKKVDGRADIYSIGAVLYHMVTGRPPFEGDDPLILAYKHVHTAPEPPRKINRAVPRDWDKLILRCLAKDPVRRFGTALELSRAIDALSVNEAMGTDEIRGQSGGTEIARSRLVRAVTPRPRLLAGPTGYASDGSTALKADAHRVEHTLAEEPKPIPSVVWAPRSAGHRVTFRSLPLRGGAAAITAILLLVSGFFAAFQNHLLSRSSSAPAGIGRPVSGWGLQQGQDRDMSFPEGVAAGRAGAVYVADKLNNRILSFSPGGRLITSWGSKGDKPGQFVAPSGVTADASGFIYVADNGNRRIQKFTPEGKYLLSYTQSAGQPLGFPSSVAVDRDGTIYVSGDGGLQKIEAHGSPMTRWPQPGALPSSMSTGPVTVDGTGRVYVVNLTLNQILILSRGGKRIGTIGNPTPSAGRFRAPRGLVVDRRGRIYVADRYNDRILAFGPQGRLLHSWGSHGTGPGQFSLPTGIAVDGRGTIYVTDSGNNRLQRLMLSARRFRPWGSTALPVLRAPTDVTIGASGNIYVASSRSGTIQVFSPNGRPAIFWTGDQRRDGNLDISTGIAADDQGNIYVARSLDNRLQKLSRTGRVRSDWHSLGPDPGQFLAPYSVAVDRHHRIYVADSGNQRVQMISPSGAALGVCSLQDIHPQYVPEYGMLQDIAVDGKGHVYVADATSNSVIRLAFFPQCRRIGVLGRDSTWGSAQPGRFRSPSGVAVDRDGNVYVSDRQNDRIQKFSPTGKLLGVMGRRGSAPGQFHNPGGLAIDAYGRLYVADTDNNRVQKFLLND